MGEIKRTAKLGQMVRRPAPFLVHGLAHDGHAWMHLVVAREDTDSEPAGFIMRCSSDGRRRAEASDRAQQGPVELVPPALPRAHLSTLTPAVRSRSRRAPIMSIIRY